MKKTILTAGVLVAMVAGSTQAASIEYNGLGYSSNVQIVHNGNTMNVAAGEIKIKINSAPFVSFCVDLDHYVQSSWSADPAPVASINGGLAAAFLYDSFKGSIDTSIKGAALQVAIWEVVDDFGGALNLGSGNFRLVGSNDIMNQANAYLGAIPADLSGYTTTSYVLQSGWNPRSQNLIVPEPGTVLSLVLGIPLFALRRRLA